MYKAIIFLSLYLFLFLPLVTTAEDNTPLNNLVVRFDLENHTISGISRISLPEGHAAVVNISGLKVLSASVNNKAIITEPGITAINFQPEEANDVLEIIYKAVFDFLPETDRSKNPGVVKGNLISPDGIALIDGWYPSIEGISNYNLTAILPNDFEGISEAEEIKIIEKTDVSREFSFTFPNPIEKVTLVAGRYIIKKDRHNNTDIFAYFLPKDRDLAKTYIKYTKKYIDMYEGLIGKYPFKRFSIVENILPTGYAMPTFTLLGQDIVRLPFILETSLGHEILHQWLGNSVYVDYASGNWSEGLTTFLSDHMYKEIKGAAWDYRKQALISFESYVIPENDFPLKSFTNRTDRTSEAIGYGKSLMVFHMLKNLVGEEIFYNSLVLFIEKNKFRPASWNDIRNAFEKSSGKDLDWFFKQWTEEKGAPEINIQNIEVKYRGSKTIVSFEIHQKGKNFKFPLNVLLNLRDGEVKRTFEIEEESTVIEIETEGIPVNLVIDNNYDIFRILAEKELPPVISRLLGDKNKIFVVPQGKSEEYTALSESLKNHGFTEKKEEDIKYLDLNSSSLIIPGIETGIVKRLFSKLTKQPQDFFLIVKENPLNSNGVIAIIDGASTEELSGYINKITHYGKYSNISFKDGKNTLKTVNSSDKGILADISIDYIGVEVPRTINTADIIEKVKNKTIVYVGESHDKFEHHRVQLEVIRELHEKNKNIAIGMEMFQKPFQKVLDDYIEGRIEEKEFLKKSEYFKRWGFNYNLYREILLYAREYKIPVIALNISRDIVSKVSKEGLHALTEEELKEVPEDIDLTDMEYKERLKEIFEHHKNSWKKNFDLFYEAQVLWDESMAHNLNEFIQKNPEYQVVVIAGVGHLAFRSGIPKRCYRLNNKDYSIILSSEDIEQDIADFVLYPVPIKPPRSPKLGVILREEEGKVKITSFIPGSISKKAGLKKNDIILSIDDTKIEGIDDIKIFLVFKKKGDDITVKVSRQRFLFGAVEKEFKITL